MSLSDTSDHSEMVPREQARSVPCDDLHVSESHGRSGGEPALHRPNLCSGMFAVLV